MGLLAITGASERLGLEYKWRGVRKSAGVSGQTGGLWQLQVTAGVRELPRVETTPVFLGAGEMAGQREVNK